jgi:ribosomal protein S18 acetylase RimI-like enzyme
VTLQVRAVAKSHVLGSYPRCLIHQSTLCNSAHRTFTSSNLLPMAELPANLFVNPVWSALHTKHRDFSVVSGAASRYPADVAPFVAVSAPTQAAMRDLCALLTPGELVYLIGEKYPHIPLLAFGETFGVLQMVLPGDAKMPEEVQPESASAPDVATALIELSAEDAEEMVALTTLAFPGYFRKRTCEMGQYNGARSGRELIAMAGERLMHDGYAEISGVCTHPLHRGKGLATRLMWQLIGNHRQQGTVSWLHVGSNNQHAIGLYERMGFHKVREVRLHPVSKKA